MMRTLTSLGCLLILLAGFSACEKETDTYPGPALEEFMPVQVGKEFIYRLDSTIILSPTNTFTRSYQCRDLIDETFTDASGKTSYRVRRQLRPVNGVGEWTDAISYSITPRRERIEVIDDNLRFIKLTLPITEGTSWYGNKFLQTDINNLEQLFFEDWEYEYQDLGLSVTVGNQTYPNTVTVFQEERGSGNPQNPQEYSDLISAKEIYAQGVGLIYKQFYYYIYQPPTPDGQPGKTTGYGLKLELLQHN